MCKRGCCLSSILILPFKLMWIILKPFLIIISAISLLSLLITFAAIPFLIVIFIYLIYLCVKSLITHSVNLGIFKICFDKLTSFVKDALKSFKIFRIEKRINYLPVVKSCKFHCKICEENSNEKIENPDCFENTKVNEDTIGEKSVSSEKREDSFNLESFMAECNAYVEHKENMEEYREYFGIDDNDNEV